MEKAWSLRKNFQKRTVKSGRPWRAPVSANGCWPFSLVRILRIVTLTPRHRDRVQWGFRSRATPCPRLGLPVIAGGLDGGWLQLTEAHPEVSIAASASRPSSPSLKRYSRDIHVG